MMYSIVTLLLSDDKTTVISLHKYTVLLHTLLDGDSDIIEVNTVDFYTL